MNLLARQPRLAGDRREVSQEKLVNRWPIAQCRQAGFIGGVLSLLIVLLRIAAIISQNDRAERFWNELDLVVRGTPYGTPYGRRASPGPSSGWSPCPLICFLSPLAAG